MRYPDGAAAAAHIRVGRPQPHPAGEIGWSCPIEADGLRVWNGATAVVGESSLQALSLALRFLHSMLLAEVERGAALHWPGDDEPMEVGLLF